MFIQKLMHTTTTPLHPPQRVSERNMLTVAILIITIALQFAALNSTWYSTEMHTQRSDLSPGAWDNSSIQQYDSLSARTTITHDSDNGSNWDDEPDAYSDSYTLENVEMLGDFDNMVLSKRLTTIALYTSMTFTIITLFFASIRSLGTPSNILAIRAPAAISLIVTTMILVSFPFLFEPLPDVSDDTQAPEITCETESGLEIPEFWYTADGENCQIDSNPALYNIQGKTGISSGYFVGLVVLFFQFYALYLVRRNE